ncbi:MAG: hypothetical protein J6D46_02125 [Lachnospiraceae bacterium]|nr:hypothetical protein [Lachnospiraceae bacterium]
MRKMKTYKILSGSLAAALLSGCGMPEMSFENADSPILKKESGKESAESAPGNVSSDSVTTGSRPAESGGSTGSGESGKAESGADENAKTDSAGTGSAKTDSAGNESAKTEPGKIYEDPKSASAISLSRTVTVKDGKYSTELTAISTETNEAASEYEELNAALKKIPEGEALPVRADSNVVSLIIREEPGSAEIASVNIDVETGDILTISDLFSDTEKLASAVGNQYGKDHPELSALTAEELDPEKFVWTLSPDGCVFYFPDPDKGDEVNETLLLRSANAELFKEKGTTVPDSFTQVFAINEDFFCDCDGDGTSDRIRVSASPENGKYRKAEVSLNGRTVQCYAAADRFAPMLMKTGGRCVLYLACEDDKVPGDIAVVDLSKDDPAYMGIPTQSTGIPYAADEDGWTETLPGDPEAFLLESTVELITSFPAVSEYKVGTDGVPEQSGEVYLAVGETVLKSLTRMKTDLIDPETGRTVEKDRTFEAGSRWTVFRSDGENYIEFNVNGEGLVRLSGDPSGTWPEKIGGVEADRLFEKISEKS